MATAMRFPVTMSVGTLAGCLLGLACGSAGFFVCSDDGDCVHAGRGVCQPNGFCSFPDAMCPSGQRYGDQAAGGFAEQCVDEDVAETTSGTATGTGDSGGAATTGPLPSTTDPTTPMSGPTQGNTGGSESTSSVTSDDTTSSDSTGPTQTTTGPATGSSTGPLGEDPYNNCDDFDQCEAFGGTCLDPDLDDVCGMPCDRLPCPDPLGGTAPPVCTAPDSSIPFVCVLPCGAEVTCPPGMNCSEDDLGLGFVAVCAWG